MSKLSSKPNTPLPHHRKTLSEHIDQSKVVKSNIISESHFGLNDEALDNDDLSDTKNFVTTARELFVCDDVDNYSDFELEKWLIAYKGHRGRALSALSETLAWRQAVNIKGLLKSDFSDFEESGMLQFCGRTSDGTPVLIYNGSRRKVPKDAAGRNREILYYIYVLERAREEGVFSDQVFVIMDRTGMSHSQMSDITTIPSTLIPILQKHYPERLKSMFIFPNSTMFWMAWKMIVMLIDSHTIKKIQLRDNASCLMIYINKENLMEKYGGDIKDMYLLRGSNSDLNRGQTKSADSLLDRNKDLKDNKEILLEGEKSLQLVLVEEIWSAPDLED